jgi:hypothetical protein
VNRSAAGDGALCRHAQSFGNSVRQPRNSSSSGALRHPVGVKLGSDVLVSSVAAVVELSVPDDVVVCSVVLDDASVPEPVPLSEPTVLSPVDDVPVVAASNSHANPTPMGRC